jgi:hypothetical protein
VSQAPVAYRPRLALPELVAATPQEAEARQPVEVAARRPAVLRVLRVPAERVVSAVVFARE